MVSTRQMTGAAIEESTLYLFRSSASSSSSNQSASTRSSAATSSQSQTNVTTNATNTSSNSSPNNNNSAVVAVPNSQQMQLPPDRSLNLLDLPVEILGHILSYTGYKKVAQMRVISHQMNSVCSSILNSTFQKLQTQMLNRFQIVKAKMPRRESARRNHPLACECDILETCSMRLSLLQMTFGKHIERKHCCFFPGGVSGIELYTEKISGRHHGPSSEGRSIIISTSILSRDTSHSSSSSPPQSNMVLRKGIRKIKQGMKRYNNQLSVLRSELRTCKRKATEQAKQIGEQQKLLAEQQKQTLEYANRLDENDKKNEEISRKFSTLLQELNKCKTELQYWRSKSPITPNCNACGQAIVAMPPEELQALVNQGVRPEEMDLPPIAEEPADVEEVIRIENAFDVDAQPMSPLPPSAAAMAAQAATGGSPRSAKRKYECIIESASDDVTLTGSPSTSGSSDSGSGSSSPLNPPFASAPFASLVASYSSAAGPSCAPLLMHSAAAVATASSSSSPVAAASSSSSCPPFSSAVLSALAPTCSSTFPHTTQTTHLPPASAAAATSNISSNMNGGSGNNSDSVNHKKLRRVQNKARSQTNHNNHNNSSNVVTNTNTKATRSKNMEK
ncbi:uncharacterized protein LOC129765854 [Toxorhynchites rutilus septentrionalis]|uniref:uncharacterized protein LOC129765854 n=1 Tax=Toxorhynchites rutilus septentrionalis TaxID=329112 RepID=UPI0024789095|nr:uncharacterized protein LOC129765854 [Toxorhynchites rutilus septentrionalis]